jgi:chemotaxis protein MotB
MRRIRKPAHENHERWLISYADFITLLFAFFVVMFASNQADRSKSKMISDSVRDALEHGQLSDTIATALGRGRHEARKAPRTPDPANKEEHIAFPKVPDPDPNPADLKKSLDTLQKGLDPELKSGKLTLQLLPRGLVISLREAAFFASGDDAVAPGSVPVLQKIAAVIQRLPNPVRLEGNTDSIPIHNARFTSNWQLSAARAIAMLEALADRCSVPRVRMAIAGYAENAPSDTNETAEGRAHNRRVDVVLLTTQGQRAEPSPPASAPLPPKERGNDK